MKCSCEDGCETSGVDRHSPNCPTHSPWTCGGLEQLIRYLSGNRPDDVWTVSKSPEVIPYGRGCIIRDGYCEEAYSSAAEAAAALAGWVNVGAERVEAEVERGGRYWTNAARSQRRFDKRLQPREAP